MSSQSSNREHQSQQWKAGRPPVLRTICHFHSGLWSRTQQSKMARYRDSGTALGRSGSLPSLMMSGPSMSDILRNLTPGSEMNWGKQVCKQVRTRLPYKSPKQVAGGKNSLFNRWCQVLYAKSRRHVLPHTIHRSLEMDWLLPDCTQSAGFQGPEHRAHGVLLAGLFPNPQSCQLCTHVCTHSHSGSVLLPWNQQMSPASQQPGARDTLLSSGAPRLWLSTSSPLVSISADSRCVHGRVCMHVCTITCAHMCIARVCTCICPCAYRCTYMCLHVFVWVYVSVCPCVYICACMCLHMWVGCVCVCPCVHAWACMCESLCACVCLHIWVHVCGAFLLLSAQGWVCITWATTPGSRCLPVPPASAVSSNTCWFISPAAPHWCFRRELSLLRSAGPRGGGSPQAGSPPLAAPALTSQEGRGTFMNTSIFVLFHNFH